MKNMTFSQFVPESNEFVVYQFLNNKEKKYRKLFKCTHEESCHKVFVSASMLFYHMMSHTNVKPYYIDLRALRQALNIHTDLQLNTN
jgi:hypothetical protein